MYTLFAIFYYHIVLSSIHKTHIYIHIDLDGKNVGTTPTNKAPKSNSRGIAGIFELGGPEENWRILSQKQLFFASNIIDVIWTCEKRDVGLVT